MDKKQHFLPNQVDSEAKIKERIAEIQLNCLKLGVDPIWKTYERTLGWYISMRHLDEEQQQQIKSWWSSIYGTTIKPLKGKTTEQKWLNTAKSHNS